MRGSRIIRSFCIYSTKRLPLILNLSYKYTPTDPITITNALGDVTY